MSSKLKAVLTYGAVLSLPMILMSVLAYVFGIEQNEYFGWISILVFIVTLVLVQKFFRDNYYNGLVNYGKLFWGTILIILTTALIMFVYTFLFYKVIAPDQIEKMLQITKVRMYESDQMTNSEVKQYMEYMSKYVMTPIALSGAALLTTFGQGLIFTLITTIFIKKKQDPFAEAMMGIEDSEEVSLDETSE